MGNTAPVENPWSRVISRETDSNKVAFRFTSVHNISFDGIQEVVASRISASDNSEPMLINFEHISTSDHRMIRSNGGTHTP